MRGQTINLRFTQFIEFKERLLAPPLFLPSLAFALGIWSASAFEVSFGLIWFAVCLSCLGILISKRQLSAIFWILFTLFLAGILRMSAFESLPPHHVKFLSNGKGVLEGRVASHPETVIKGKKRMTRFLMNAENWRVGRITYPAKGTVQVFIFYASENISYGDRLRLRGELTAPKRATNPEEFDYAAYLKKQGVYKVCQAFGKKSVWLLKGPAGSFWRVRIEELRSLIQRRILTLFPGPQNEVIQALWLGFRRNIPDDINSIFVRTGTIHLLSISGLHVTLVGGFFYFLLRSLGAPRKLNAFLSIWIIIFYALIAGAMPPVLRAACMGIFILSSILFEQDVDSWNVLIIAFFLMILWNPGAVFLLSFQLSFLSMAVLILFSKQGGRLDGAHPKFFEVSWKEKIKKWLSETIRTSCLIVVILLPVFASYFHLSSLLGIIANTIAIPVSLWVMLLSLAAFLISFIHWEFAVSVAMLASNLFSALFFILSQLSKVAFLNWHLAGFPAAASLVYYGLLAVFYWHPFLKQIRRILIAGSVLLFLTAFSFLVPNGVTFFDAGHSDVILIRFSNKQHLLISAGRRLSDSRLNWVIEPSLLSTGTYRLFVLFDDMRKNLSRESMKILTRNFSLKDFDAVLFPGVDLFWLTNGKLAACRFTLDQKQILILFQATESLIEDFKRQGIQGFDVLYLAGMGRRDFQRQPLRFLSDLGAKHIIFNDRKLPSDFLSRLKGLGHSKLHFLSESGAVSV